MPPTRAAITEWMVQFVCNTLEISRDAFTVDDRFDAYGLDSLEVVVMAGLMEDSFGMEIDAELMFKVPSIQGTVDALVAAGIVRAD